MATLDELQQQLAALSARVDALTTPPDDYYTSKYSGEEIDAGIDKTESLPESWPLPIASGGTGAAAPQLALANLGGRPNRNLFPNWLWSGGGSQKGYGVFPINQRGKTSVNKPADYPMLNDRWHCTPATIAEIVNEGITITADFQVGMLKSELEIGKTYTFSTVTADNLMGKITFELTDGISINTNVGPCNLVVYDDSTSWAFRVYGYGKTHVAVKLEEGDKQTLCYKDSNDKWILTETPDFSAELTKCQRDFVSGIVQTSILPWNGITFVGGTVFPAEMTKLPTIRIFSEKGGEENKVLDLNGTVQSPSVVEKYPTTKGLKAIRMDAALETTKSYTYYYEASTGM